MKTTPWILGVIPLALVAGAATGTAINTTPLPDTHAHWLDSVPQHELTSAQIGSAERGAQDHYPLQTSDGVVPVAELSSRGLYRDRMVEVPAYYRADYYEEQADSVEFAAVPDSRDVRAHVTADRVQDVRPDRPARLTVLESDGNARVIDVSEELAQRSTLHVNETPQPQS